MSWRVHVRQKAEKQLTRLPNNNAQKIHQALDELARDPFRGDIQKLKDEPSAWRKRVGSYRIFYKILIQEKVVYIYEIKRRTSNTY